MPVSFHNMIAVQEMVLHAWDLAAATGQEFHPDRSTLVKLHAFLADVAADAPRLWLGVLRSGCLNRR